MLKSNKKIKYIYYEDQFGSVVGYIDDLQPNSEDQTMVSIIAERHGDGQWSSQTRDTVIMIDLRKTKKWKFYENHEEFFAEYFEAIL